MTNTTNPTPIPKPSRLTRSIDWTRRRAPFALVPAVVLTLAPFLGGVSALADLFAQFLLQAAAGSAALALVLIALRRRRLAAVALLCLCAQLWVLTHYAGLKPAMAAPHATGTKIFALNVWGRSKAYDEVIDLVRRESPDIVVLVEVTPRWRRAMRALGADYPYQIDCIGKSNCDLMLFSRRPWVSAAATHDYATYASVIEARFMLDDGPLTVFGTHLMRPIGIGDLNGQMAQADVLARHIEAASGRKIVIGDFNAVPWGRVVTTLEARTGMRVLPGLEGTWPAPLPWPLRLPIDQAMVSADAVVASRRIGPVVGSDHSPVIVQLAKSPN
jgi:endonuclease/exonuclease/phosphatase (EEP) superfamily protein YafD